MHGRHCKVGFSHFFCQPINLQICVDKMKMLLQGYLIKAGGGPPKSLKTKFLGGEYFS